MSNPHDDTDDRDLRRALDAWTPMAPPEDFAERVLAVRAARTPAAARTKRVWWLAAPVAAVATIVLVLALGTDAKDAASPTAGEKMEAMNAQSVAHNGATEHAGAGSAAVALNQPVGADAGVASVPTAVDEAETEIAIPAGTSATIHDAGPPTALHVDVAARCGTGATVTASRANGEVVTRAGRTRVVFSLDVGAWTYEVRCASDLSTIAATGMVHVLLDDLTRESVPELQITSIGFASRGSAIRVRGATLPDWTLAIGADAITVGKDLRFEATVRGFGRLVIRAEHPRHGVHYYVTLPITR